MPLLNEQELITKIRIVNKSCAMLMDCIVKQEDYKVDLITTVVYLKEAINEIGVSLMNIGEKI